MSSRDISMTNQGGSIAGQAGKPQMHGRPTPAQPHRATFGARFRRCHTLLYFIAGQILDSREGVEEALRNCWIAASRKQPKFEHESAFRSWLLRILIDEALAIRARTPQPRRSGVACLTRRHAGSRP
jgi:DNA-directed RNA polymerase specialized sigma24 family protein